jgi:hypothetical protein
MLLNCDYLTVGCANDRASNTRIVELQGLYPHLRGENLTKSLFLSLWIAYDEYILVGLGV